MEMLPRERMIKEGAEALKDDELLAIMLGVGSGAETVFAMAKRLEEEYGLSKLFHMSYKELSRIPGIKEAKACKLMAVFEIVKRIMKQEKERKEITTSKELFEHVYPDYMGYKKEVLTVIYVDSACRILKEESYSQEEYDRIYLPVKKIIRHMLEEDAFGLFLVHNHPGGTASPSLQDDEATDNLTSAVRPLGLHLFDHIIIAGEEYYSYSDHAHSKNAFFG